MKESMCEGIDRAKDNDSAPLSVKIADLEQQIAELKAQLEPDVEIGKWYIENYYGWLIKVNKIGSNGEIIGLLFDDLDNYENDDEEICKVIDIERKATAKEVEEALRKEWARITKEYGWDDPDEAELINHSDGHEATNSGYYKVYYDSEDDTLWNKNGCVYHNGKFATPKKKDRDRFFLWEVEYKQDGVMFAPECDGRVYWSKVEIGHIVKSLKNLHPSTTIKQLIKELKKLDL